ncbi:hypothetical protein Ahy_A09g045185 [Arachis hypogaea]|uniref:Retrotransposon gag domain-containing protein n=1 Tax=Arachis hypogaea TaxID=3818 RepID=A0A445BLT1_ARAHY|nr:hypothetical protein Ahy_A09g045185 [Arachis hypogaea]
MYKVLNGKNFWTSRRPRVRLKNNGVERATIHKAHWDKAGQLEDSDDEGSSYAKKSSQFQIRAFKGRNNPEAYFRWERKVESIFANCILSKEKKVQLVQANFSNVARILWNELGRSRRRYKKRPISSWEKMKKIMRR